MCQQFNPKVQNLCAELRSPQGHSILLELIQANHPRMTISIPTNSALVPSTGNALSWQKDATVLPMH